MTFSVQQGMESVSVCTDDKSVKEEGELSDDGDVDSFDKTVSRWNKPFVCSSRNSGSGKTKYNSVSRARRKRGHSPQNENVLYNRATNDWNESRSATHIREPIRPREASPREIRDGPFDRNRERRQYPHIPRLRERTDTPPFNIRDHGPEFLPSRPFSHSLSGLPHPKLRPSPSDLHHADPYRVPLRDPYNGPSGGSFHGLPGGSFHGPSGHPQDGLLPVPLGLSPLSGSSNRPFSTSHGNSGKNMSSSWRRRKFTPSKNSGGFKYTDYDRVQDETDMAVNDSDDYDKLLAQHRHIQALLANLNEEEEKADKESADHISADDEVVKTDGKPPLNLDEQRNVKITISPNESPNSSVLQHTESSVGDNLHPEKGNTTGSGRPGMLSDGTTSMTDGAVDGLGTKQDAASSVTQGANVCDGEAAEEEDEDSDLLELRRLALASKNHTNIAPRSVAVGLPKTSANSVSSLVSEIRESISSKSSGNTDSRHGERGGLRGTAGTGRSESRTRTTSGSRLGAGKLSALQRERRLSDLGSRSIRTASRRTGRASQRHPESSGRQPHGASHTSSSLRTPTRALDRGRQTSRRPHQTSDREKKRLQIARIMQLEDQDEKMELFLKLLSDQESLQQSAKVGSRTENWFLRSSSRSEPKDRILQLQDNYDEVEMDIDSNDEESGLDDLQFDPDIQAAVKPLPPVNCATLDPGFHAMQGAGGPGHWAPPFMAEPGLLTLPGIMLPPPPPPTEDSLPPQPPPPLPEEPPPKPPLPQEPPPDEDGQPPAPPLPDEDEEDDDEADVLRQQLLRDMARKKKEVEVENEKQAKSVALSPSSQLAKEGTATSDLVPEESVASKMVVPNHRLSPRNSPSSVPVVSTPSPSPVPTLPVLNRLVIPMDSSDDEGDSRAPTAFSLGGLDQFLKAARKSVESKATDKKAENSAEAAEAESLLHLERCREVHRCEQKYILERETVSREKVFLLSLIRELRKHQLGLRRSESKRNVLREQLAAYEKIVSACGEQVMRTLNEIAKTKENLLSKQKKLEEQEQQVRSLGQMVYGAGYSLQKNPSEPPPAKKPRLDFRNLTITVAEEGAGSTAAARQERIVALVDKASLQQKKLAAAALSRVVVGRPKGKPSKTRPIAAPGKLSKAELIAKEKLRLQKLEQEYAAKIRFLKERQLHHQHPNQPHRAEASKPQPLSLQTAPAAINMDIIKVGVTSLTPSCSQTAAVNMDIIKLEAPVGGDSEEGEDSQPVAPRRRSLQDLDSSTRPNLPVSLSRQPSDPKTADAGAAASQDSKSDVCLKIPGLKHLGNLRTYQQQKAERALQTSCHRTSNSFHSPVSFPSLLPPVSQIPDLKFRKEVSRSSDSTAETSVKLAYSSPLLMFGAYRFSPYFRTKEGLSLSSFTICNKLDASCVLCRYDLQGTCHDENCAGQHLSRTAMTEREQLEDVVAYCPGLAGADSNASPEEIATAIRSYVEKLVKQHEGKMTHDELLLLLTAKVTEHAGQVRPFTMFYKTRKWKPTQEKGVPQKINVENPVRKTEFETLDKFRRMAASDAVVLNEDVRYFGANGRHLRDLECAVVDDPTNVRLWLQLADRVLGDSERHGEEVLNKALNVLARGVEVNKSSWALWSRYLSLYRLHNSATDIAELFQTALEYTPNYSLWWQYLDSCGPLGEKLEVCCGLLEYLQEEGSREGASTPLISHQVLETLLYRANLNTQAGFGSRALEELKEVVEDEKKAVLGLLLPSDQCVLWSAYIHLAAFHRLPPRLLPPHSHNPGPLLTKEVVAWLFEEELQVPVEEVVVLFETAIEAVASQQAPTLSADLLVAAPLLQNYVLLLKSQSRWEEACKVCRQMLERCPALVNTWLMVADMYVAGDLITEARSVFSEAVHANGLSAKLYLYFTHFEIAQGDPDRALEELEQFAIRHFDLADPSTCDPNTLYCHLLGLAPPFHHQTIPPLQPGITRESLQRQNPYLWLCYCLLLELQGALAEVVEVFETALSTTVAADQLPVLWTSYLQYHQRNSQSGVSISTEKLQQLMMRSITSTPTKFARPFTDGETWLDYGPVNQMVEWYLSLVPQSEHHRAWETFLELMPSNVELLLRFCGDLVSVGELRRAQSLCSTAVCEHVANVALWKMVLALALKQGSSKEVEKLYLQAVQALPYTLSLWKDFLLFEVVEGHRENAEQILAHCHGLGLRMQGIVAMISS